MLALTSQWNSLRSAAMPTRLSVTPNIPGAAAGRLTVMGAAKVPFFNRGTVAKMMGLSESPVDLIENDVGGGFGARGEFYPEDFLIPFAARHVGRPVMWIEDRREHLIAINHARQMDCDVEIACKRDGRAQ
jgi:carbon-monoxide dehydrogenase large subunit